MPPLKLLPKGKRTEAVRLIGLLSRGPHLPVQRVGICAWRSGGLRPPATMYKQVLDSKTLPHGFIVHDPWCATTGFVWAVVFVLRVLCSVLFLSLKRGTALHKKP